MLRFLELNSQGITDKQNKESQKYGRETMGHQVCFVAKFGTPSKPMIVKELFIISMLLHSHRILEAGYKNTLTNIPLKTIS